METFQRNWVNVIVEEIVCRNETEANRGLIGSANNGCIKEKRFENFGKRPNSPRKQNESFAIGAATGNASTGCGKAEPAYRSAHGRNHSTHSDEVYPSSSRHQSYAGYRHCRPGEGNHLESTGLISAYEDCPVWSRDRYCSNRILGGTKVVQVPLRNRLDKARRLARNQRHGKRV